MKKSQSAPQTTQDMLTYNVAHQFSNQDSCINVNCIIPGYLTINGTP